MTRGIDAGNFPDRIYDQSRKSTYVRLQIKLDHRWSRIDPGRFILDSFAFERYSILVCISRSARDKFYGRSSRAEIILKLKWNKLNRGRINCKSQYMLCKVYLSNEVFNSLIYAINSIFSIWKRIPSNISYYFSLYLCSEFLHWNYIDI